MRGFIAYSQPQGVYGRYVFTILVYFSLPTESVEISVRRYFNASPYSCHSCGKWATITLSPSDHSTSGSLAFYRFDTVEPEDNIELKLTDSDLLYSQITQVNIKLKDVSYFSYFYKSNDGYRTPIKHEQIYEVSLINWDEYVQERTSGGQQLRVEEELVQQTMRAEPITIKELRLEPMSQLPAIVGQQQFIEGELRYLTD